MARLTRVHQKVFASNASNNGVFGSFQAGNPQTSNDVATLQSLSAFENGWDDAIEQGDKLPPLEEFQGIQYGISYQQAYILQEGIPEWNTNTAYYKGSLVKTISGTSFKIFSSLTDNNTGNSTTNTAHWKLAYDSDVGYADANFSNLLSPAKNIANWSNNVTNCITEIPQDIKLELSSGTLTLKAGSKVYVPNGAGVFDEVNISSDMTATGTTNNVYFLFLKSDGSQLLLRSISATTSGPTSSAPSGSGTFYDTDNNKIYWYSSGSPSYRQSFPLAIITVSNGAISSIDQVFNGFGYIGSTIFALKGVKGLQPNGRNSDGTLKNVLRTATSVLTQTVSTQNGDRFVMLTQTPSITNYASSNYKSDENYNKGNDGSIQNAVCVGHLTMVDGKVSQLSVKPVFHAVDYYDFETENSKNVKYSDFATQKATTTSTAGTKTPAVIVENYKNGSDWYRVWSDGWIEQGGASPTFSSSNTDTTVTVNLLKPFTDTNYSVLALSDDCGYRPALTYSNKTTSSFKLRRESHSGSIRSGIADWRACGY